MIRKANATARFVIPSSRRAPDRRRGGEHARVVCQLYRRLVRRPARLLGRNADQLWDRRIRIDTEKRSGGCTLIDTSKS